MVKLLVAAALAVSAFAGPELIVYHHNVDYRNRATMLCTQQRQNGTDVIVETRHTDPVLFEGQVIMVDGIDAHVETVGGFPLTFCSFR